MAVTNAEHVQARAVAPVDRPGDRSGGRMEDTATVRSRWLRLLVAGLVGVLAAAASFKLRTVPVPTDPWHYVLAGSTFPAVTWNSTGLTRYGMVLPMVVVTRFFHDSELSFFLTPCLATGLLIGAVYWLTTRFFGWIAGAAAAVLVLANSVVLVNSSRMYPDVFATAMATLGIATAVGARDQWQREGRVRGKALSLLLLTGVFVGLSWWMRETAIFAWPVIGALLLRRGGPPRRVSLPAVAVPAVVLLGVEMLVSAWAFGDPPARFKALTGGDLSATTNPADLPYLGQSRLTYLLTMPRGMLLFHDGHWMVVMAAVAVVSGLVFPRKVGLFAGWFVLVFVLFALAGGGLRPAHPNIRLDVARYWVAYLPAMVMAAVGGVSTLLVVVSRRWRRGGTIAGPVGAAVVALVLVAGPVVASAQEVRANPTFVVTNGNVTAQFRNWLHANDKDVRRVYTDSTTVRLLPTYARSFSGHRMAKVHWRTFAQGRPRPGDYVVLFSRYDLTCMFCNLNLDARWLPGHLQALKRWDKVWQSTDRRFVVYRVPPRR
jgi:hypothetical protein